MKKRPRDIAVIGAGLGGLAVSIRLAARGHHVRLFEKNGAPGGKIQEIVMDGYRFDAGPGLLTLPNLLRDLVEMSGNRLEDHLTLVQPDPLCRYFYPDGSVFDNFQDMSQTVGQIRRFAPADSLAWSRFLAYSENLYDRTRDSFLHNPLYQLTDLKSLKLSDFLKIDAFSTVSNRVDTYFESDKLRQFFKRFATYNGSSPFQAPATLNVIPHVEIGMGGYYIRGGIYRISKVLEKIALNAGVRIFYNSRVKSINITDGRASGIQLENGSREPCDLVVSNSDAIDTVFNLIGPGHIPLFRRRHLEKLEPSSSAFVLLLGTDRKWKQLHHHNVFFSSDYEKEFSQLFNERIPAADPTIYVTNTSHTDPGDAPGNGSNLFVLVNAPCLTEDQDWTSLKKSYTHRIIRKLEQCGLDGLGEAVQVQKVLTPVDFSEQFRSHRGSLYGSSSNGRMSAFLRPANKLRGLEGVYLAGGSTHPGGGIPLVLLSAMNAVNLIERYEE